MITKKCDFCGLEDKDVEYPKLINNTAYGPIRTVTLSYTVKPLPGGDFTGMTTYTGEMCYACYMRVEKFIHDMTKGKP